MNQTIHDPRRHLTAVVSERWLLAQNRRCSGFTRDWTDEPTVHALVVESVTVEEEHRRQGHCRSFLEELCRDERFEIIVVEGVGNRDLADALLRWGWDCDAGVMDFFLRRDRP